jgi:plastocyanin
MRRSLLLIAAAFVLILGLGLGTFAVAQESTPTAEEEETVCPEAMGTPEAMETGEEMGTPEAMTEDAPSASPSAEESCHVDIENTAFEPANIEVAVGTTVTWENYDDPSQTGPHTVTADDGSFDSGNLELDDTFSHTFDAAGEFAYHCANHPNMTGTVMVH